MCQHKASLAALLLQGDLLVGYEALPASGCGHLDGITFLVPPRLGVWFSSGGHVEPTITRRIHTAGKLQSIGEWPNSSQIRPKYKTFVSQTCVRQARHLRGKRWSCWGKAMLLWKLRRCEVSKRIVCCQFSCNMLAFRQAEI